MKVNGPISEELKELTVKVQEHWSDLADEIMHVESVVDALIILNLERTHRWQGIRVGSYLLPLR
jgi:hypothetical protein